MLLRLKHVSVIDAAEVPHNDRPSGDTMLGRKFSVFATQALTHPSAAFHANRRVEKWGCPFDVCFAMRHAPAPHRALSCACNCCAESTRIPTPLA
eukprot:357124-Chlamydomonas_euryale.AAC.3